MAQQYHVRFVQVPCWLALVAGALAIAFAVALFLLSLTVFLLVLPVILVAGALYYLFGPRRNVRGDGLPPDGGVIEGEYRVIEQERLGAGRKDH